MENDKEHSRVVKPAALVSWCCAGVVVGLTVCRLDGVAYCVGSWSFVEGEYAQAASVAPPEVPVCWLE